jgi:hypothetical protein
LNLIARDAVLVAVGGAWEVETDEAAATAETPEVVTGGWQPRGNYLATTVDAGLNEQLSPLLTKGLESLTF